MRLMVQVRAVTDIDQFFSCFELDIRFTFVVYLHCQTNNLYIMKKSRIFDSERLISDVYFHLLAVWLLRNELYDRFVKNLARSLNFKGSTNLLIREHIRYLIESPLLSMNQAITSAFLFTNTPEGSFFWERVSDDWIRFFGDFSRK